VVKRTCRTDRPPSSDVRYEQLVTELAEQPDTWRRMLVEHHRDPVGYCAAKVCREPGTGRPYLVWPCPSRLLALRAERHRRGRR
jgi:hypothetical protein